MKDINKRRIQDCLRCRDHMMQTSCAVICGFSGRNSPKELELILCENPFNDFIQDCPRVPRRVKS